jgi:hypothetical protein
MSALPTTAMSSRVSGGVTKVRGSKPNSWEKLCFEHSRFTQAVKELVDSDTVGSSTGTRVSRRVQVRKIKVEQEVKAEKIAATPATLSSQQVRKEIADLAESDPAIAHLLFLINWKY